MALYLKSDNNLSDVDSLECARKNLGLGSMSTQTANSVDIQGGSVAVDSFVYNHSSRDSSGANALLKVNDANVLEFVNYQYDWMFKPQNQIDVSDFKYDDLAEDRYVRYNELADVAISGNFQDLKTGKTLLASKLFNDIQYLHVKSNLADVDDKLLARSNLGIGTLGLSNWDSFFVVNSLSIGALYMDLNDSDHAVKTLLAVEDNRLVPYSINKADHQNYGFVRLTDDIFSAANEKYDIPSIYAMNNYYNLTLNKITSIDINNIVLSYDLDTIIQNYGLLRKENNLSEIPIQDLYNSFQLGTMAMLNQGDDILAKDLILDDQATIQFINTNIDGIPKYLMVNEKGELVISTAKPIASDTKPGMVFLMSNYIEDYTLGGITSAMSKFRNDVVPSAGAVQQFFELYDFEVERLEKSIPKSIKDVNGFGEFMLIEDNMHVDNPSIARTNLELAEVAHTGNWYDIVNRPESVSYFSNDMGYLKASECLAEISANPDQARYNLGLGNLATMDSNAVQFLGGSGTFESLRVQTNFQYNKGADNQGKFLSCKDPQGNAEWRELPKASQNQYGVVCVTNSLNDNDDGKAVSASAIFKIYTEMTTRLNIYLDLITTIAQV